MRVDDFNHIVDAQIAKCRAVLVKKADEYSVASDKLHNFKVASDIQGCTVRQAVAGMMVKHTVSVYDMCASDKEFDLELWDEKITDYLNYLLLLKAAVIEETWDTMGVLPVFEPAPTEI